MTATTAKHVVSRPAAPERKWFNITEAAIWCGLSKETIRRAKRAGHLQPKKTAERGGRELYRITDLDRWLEGLDDA